MAISYRARSTAPVCRTPGPERRRERRLRVQERRSGFDRRRNVCRSPVLAALETPALRLRDQPVLFLELLIMINLLSVLDLLITLIVLEMGAAELNPLMAYLIDAGPVQAAGVKIGVVALATLGLWLLRRYRAALTTAVILFAAYASLVIFELVGLIRFF
ncbi:MAG: hypothetical protein GX624_08445 [Actinobacteria bacterium]|nr:hypothetical protein [Actinomycetota bacterium]